MNDKPCPFCNIAAISIVDESDTCLVIRDGYPVTHLHTLIVTKQHVASYFDLNDEQLKDVNFHIENERKAILNEDPTVTGFNIGINCGEDAGQTVMHCHVHIIPRRRGDTPNPRGGVRGVIPGKQSY